MTEAALQDPWASGYTDEELVKKYVELRDEVRRRTADFDELLRPLKQGMELIEGVFLGRLNERKAQNSRTEYGTAFKVRTLTIKVAEPMTFLRYTLDNWQAGGVDLLQIGAVKKAVGEYCDNHDGKPPPGLETTAVINVNIRKA
jgi:hypothetical protein